MRSSPGVPDTNLGSLQAARPRWIGRTSPGTWERGQSLRGKCPNSKAKVTVIRFGAGHHDPSDPRVDPCWARGGEHIPRKTQTTHPPKTPCSLIPTHPQLGKGHSAPHSREQGYFPTGNLGERLLSTGHPGAWLSAQICPGQTARPPRAWPFASVAAAPDSAGLCSRWGEGEVRSRRNQLVGGPAHPQCSLPGVPHP